MKSQVSTSTFIVVLVVVVLAVIAIGWYLTSTKKGETVDPDAQQKMETLMGEGGQQLPNQGGSPATPATGGGEDE